MRSSWLFPDGHDRQRLVDAHRHLRPGRRKAFGALALALLACGPWVGWWTLVPLGVALVAFTLADRQVDRAERPELPVFAAWAFSEAVIAASIALTGGPHSPALSWLAIPLITLGGRFSSRGIAVGFTLTVALTLAVTLGVDAGAVIDDPPVVLAQLGMLTGVVLLQSAVMRADFATREEAVIDPLTSLLNRKALAVRAGELSEQSSVTGEPVGVIVGDLDHFKAINDEHGHAAGDVVLRDAAYTLRKALRAFDLVYRLGGEEFLVLLPGSSAEEAGRQAERLRLAIGAAGLGPEGDVTMSFGVSASARGASFAYDTCFAEADAALYAAKAAGRDRVRCAAALDDSRPVAFTTTAGARAARA